jgi:SAM-dependent methyltransferase
VSVGLCPVCGWPAAFVGFGENLRESGFCRVCGSTNRQRQMAVALLAAVGALSGTRLGSLAALARTASPHPARGLAIYNTESRGCVDARLRALPGYVASEYVGPGHPSGTVVAGVRHEDLRATSFPPAAFDLVLSSDVFEHIPAPYDAFREVHRILKVGGRHVFTVPFYSDRYRDEVRAVAAADGTVQHLLPPIHHADPLRPEGVLVYVIFSLEMLGKLEALGFAVRLYDVRSPLHGILGTNAMVFEAVRVH